MLAQNPNRVIDSLLSVLKTVKEDTGKLYTLISIAEQYLNHDDLARAAVFSEQSRSLAGQLKIKSGWASVYSLMGKIEEAKENYQNAEQNFKDALSINEEIGNKQGVANNLLNIGYVHSLYRTTPEEFNYADSALKIFEELGDKYGQMKAMHNVGLVTSNPPTALEYFFSSLRLARELGDKNIIASSLQQIAIIYRDEGNYPEAWKNFNECLKIRRELKRKIGIAGVLISMARAYDMQGNHDEALKTFYEGLNLIDQKRNRALTAYLFGQIGDILTIKGNYEEAMKNHRASLKIWEELQQQGGISLSCQQIGELLFKQAAFLTPQKAKSKYAEAIQFLNRGISLTKQLGNNGIMKDSYKTLANIYMAMADYKKAFEYNNLYVAMQDSIMNNETVRKLEQLRTKYEVEQAVTGEKRQYESAMAKQNADHRRKNELLLTGLGVLTIISFFTVLLIRQRNRKKRAVDKAEAGHKMAELELQSLRAQLNPHFMFNSLNAIQDLIVNEKNEQSHLYLSRFSKLLRMLLDNADQPFVSLKKEVEFLELYLSLENLRIPDLQFSIEKSPGVNLEERMIPNMMLQPYIENAIWHGLSNKKGNRKLQIRIHENGNATKFEIEDNGIGRKKAAEIKNLYRKGHTSKGMELLSKRFSLLSKEYGSSIQTTVTDLENNGEATGTLVKIEVPFSLSSQARQLIHDTNHYN